MPSRRRGEAGQRTAIAWPLVEVLVGPILLAAGDEELRFVARLPHVRHFPIARSERPWIAAIERHGIELREACPLRLEVDIAIVLHPAERHGAGSAHPRVIVFGEEHARLAG